MHVTITFAITHAGQLENKINHFEGSPQDNNTLERNAYIYLLRLTSKYKRENPITQFID